MTRIDEACGDFRELSVIHKALQDMQAVLDSRQDVDAKVLAVRRIMASAYNEVRLDYQAYAVFENVFTKNTAFNHWQRQLKPGMQGLLSDFIGTMCPAKDTENHLISKEDKSYQGPRYSQQTQSAWLTRQQQSGSEAEKAVADISEKFIRQERINISLAAEIPVYFFEYLHHPELTKEDRGALKNYLAQLSQLRAYYDNLSLEEVLHPADKPLASVLDALCAKYQSADYQQYIEALEDLTLSQFKIADIFMKHGQIQKEARDLVGKQTSILTQHKIMLQSLQEACKGVPALAANQESLTQTVASAKKNDAVARGISDYHMMLKGSADKASRERVILGQLILQSSLTRKTDMESKVREGVYLEQELIEVFPQAFKKDGRAIKVEASNASEIYAALGGKPRSGEVLEPARFDVRRLRALGAEPAWLVLSALKPLDHSHTLQEKVAVFHGLIDLAKTGKLKISDKSQLEQAQEIAQKVLTLVVERLQTHPEEDDQALMEAMKGIYKLIHSGTLSRNVLGKITSVEAQYKEFIKRGPGEVIPYHVINRPVAAPLKRDDPQVASSMSTLSLSRESSAGETVVVQEAGEHEAGEMVAAYQGEQALDISSLSLSGKARGVNDEIGMSSAVHEAGEMIAAYQGEQALDISSPSLSGKARGVNDEIGMSSAVHEEGEMVAAHQDEQSLNMSSQSSSDKASPVIEEVHDNSVGLHEEESNVAVMEQGPGMLRTLAESLSRQASSVVDEHDVDSLETQEASPSVRDASDSSALAHEEGDESLREEVSLADLDRSIAQAADEHRTRVNPAIAKPPPPPPPPQNMNTFPGGKPPPPPPKERQQSQPSQSAMNAIFESIKQGQKPVGGATFKLQIKKSDMEQKSPVKRPNENPNEESGDMMNAIKQKMSELRPKIATDNDTDDDEPAVSPDEW